MPNANTRSYSAAVVGVSLVACGLILALCLVAERLGIVGGR